MKTLRLVVLSLGFASVASAQVPPPQPPPAQPPAAYPQPPPGQPAAQLPYYPPGPGTYAPPPPGYAPYPYGPPPYPYPAPYSVQFPEEIDDEGQPLPPGYRKSTRVRKGLVIAGPIVFGVPYLYSLLASSVARDYGELAVPVLGPLIALRHCSSTSNNGCQSVLLLDFAMQGAGAAMLILGIAAPRKVFLLDPNAFAPRVSMSVVPTALGKNAGGLGVVGEF